MLEKSVIHDKTGGMNVEQNTDNLIIKATSDLIIATLFSAPKNEPILRGVINAVLTNSGHVPIPIISEPTPLHTRSFNPTEAKLNRRPFLLPFHRSLSAASQNDVSLQISGTVTVSQSVVFRTDLTSGEVVYEDRCETNSEISIVMESSDSSFTALETVHTLITNTLRINVLPDGIVSTELSGTELAQITYTGSGHATSDDPTLFGLESEDLTVLNFEMSTTFEYDGTESYSMEFIIVSLEQEIVAQNEETEWETISLTGEYLAETSSSLRTVDTISTSYELVGADETHTVTVSLQDGENSLSEANWVSSLDSEGEWQLSEGESSLEGIVHTLSFSLVTSVVETDETSTDTENDTRTGTIGQSFCKPVVDVLLDENQELEWKQIAFSANVKTKQGSGVSRDEAGFRSSRVDNDWTTDGGFIGKFGTTVATPIGGPGVGSSAGSYSGNNNNNGNGNNDADTWQDQRTHGKTEIRNDWDTTDKNYSANYFELQMSGTKTLKGYTESKYKVNENGSVQKTYESDKTETVDVKKDSGKDTGKHYLRDHAYEQSTVELAEDENGDLVETGGNGSQSGSRTWNYKYDFDTVKTGTDDNWTKTKIDGNGNYSDSYSGTTDYDVSSQSMKLVSGFGSGNGKVEHNVTTDTYEQSVSNVEWEGTEGCHGTPTNYKRYEKETLSSHTKSGDSEKFSLSLTISETGGWNEFLSGTRTKDTHGTTSDQS